MHNTALFVAVFLASAVEAVEALTIVLAAGTARGWRPALAGVVAGLAVLAACVAVLGPAVAALPIDGLRLIVGTLLVIFGLQWLRKAILRASGFKARHDEAALYRSTLAAAERNGPTGGGIDGYGFTLAFKGVVLEGLEVVFIVVTFGSSQHRVGAAALAAAVALAVVTVVGFVVHAPLARVPENTMKFVVGVMLTGFGTYWAAEGAGGSWPGEDLALLILVPGIGLYALVLVAVLRRRHGPADRTITADLSDRQA